MDNKVCIVGGGISGLTAAAYSVKSGFETVLYEKEDTLGGLVGSFEYKGFLFDQGIRATENAGTLFPMLKDLGLFLNASKNKVTIGIKDQMILLDQFAGLEEYQNMLLRIFPDQEGELDQIFRRIRKVSKYMDVLYGIDNPLFLNPKENPKYFVKKILPWMFKYAFTIKKIEKMNQAINEYLHTMTDSEALVDMVTQHFFEDTPSFFALGYFRLYMDYFYPSGGTGKIVELLEEYILSNGGTIYKNAEVTGVDLKEQIIFINDEMKNNYHQLIWAADMKSLYCFVDLNSSGVNKQTFFEQKKSVMNAKGNGSIFSLYVMLDLNKNYFEKKCGEHSFYTPSILGLRSMEFKACKILKIIERESEVESQKILWNWIAEYLKKTTFEISIPVLRDSDLAPEGQSGIIISTVFDYDITKYFYDNDKYDELKEGVSECIIDVLTKSIFLEMKENVLEYFSVTPITMEKRLHNSNGAITGWSFSGEIPVVDKFHKIAKSVNTPFENIYQSGHWTFSPSGLPTAIITGKLAVDEIVRKGKKEF